ncbi:MAG: hypothetical protein ACKVRP_03145 [Bacteroidota bacterium]
MKLFPPRAPIGEFDTSYTANVKGNKVTIILSGFIKYMDNYAKRRLGVEIKKYMQELAIGV